MRQTTNYSIIHQADGFAGLFLAAFSGMPSVSFNEVSELRHLTPAGILTPIDAIIHVPAFKKTRNGFTPTTDSAFKLEEVCAAAERIGVSKVINIEPMPRIGTDDHVETYRENIRSLFTQGRSNQVQVVTIKVPLVYQDSAIQMARVFSKFINAFQASLAVQALAERIVEITPSVTRSNYLFADNKDENSFYRFGKRVTDVAVSAVGLMLSAVILPITFGLVRLESEGAGTFRQQRLGKNKVPFECIKVRSMYQGTKETDSHAAGASAVTRVGRVIRKLKIDETPQFINVLRGDLSLVGPRPCIRSLDTVIKAREDAGIFDIQPGLTGLAQIRHEDTSMPDRMVATEELYKCSRNLFLDLKIILATALGHGLGDKAV